MEDHLKNKNWLEKEWVALCVYQAKPNSSLVAQREENVPKNRSPAVLTCTYQAMLWAGGGELRLSRAHHAVPCLPGFLQGARGWGAISSPETESVDSIVVQGHSPGLRTSGPQ